MQWFIHKIGTNEINTVGITYYPSDSNVEMVNTTMTGTSDKPWKRKTIEKSFVFESVI